MKIAILTNDQANQVALCNKLAEKVEIAAIVLSQNVPRKKPALLKRLQLKKNALAGSLLVPDFKQTWFEMLGRYGARYRELPSTRIVRVQNVNDSETVATIETSGAELVVVSGTNLVGKKVISAAKERMGIVNLHTGISPYVKGGPNCTNWCLAKGWFHLIGNTVMWLDLGIDTGNIIATERTHLDGSEDLVELHWKVMEHAHDLYVRSISKIAAGRPVNSVPQDEIGSAATLYSVEWGLGEMRAARHNFYNSYRSHFEAPDRRTIENSGVRLIPLDKD